MLKNVSVLNVVGLTTLTVEDSDSGNRVWVLADTSTPADQSLSRPRTRVEAEASSRVPFSC